MSPALLQLEEDIWKSAPTSPSSTNSVYSTNSGARSAESLLLPHARPSRIHANATREMTTRPDSLNAVSLVDLDIDALLDACLAPLPAKHCGQLPIPPTFDPERTPRPDDGRSRMTRSSREYSLQNLSPNCESQLLKLKTHQTHSDFLSFPLPPAAFARPGLTQHAFLAPQRPPPAPPLPIKDRFSDTAPLALAKHSKSSSLLPSPTINDFGTPPISPSTPHSTRSNLSLSQSSTSTRASDSSFAWSTTSRSTGATTPDPLATRKANLSRDRSGSDLSFSSYGHTSVSSVSSLGPLTPPCEEAEAYSWDDTSSFASPVWQQSQSTPSLSLDVLGDDDATPIAYPNKGRGGASPRSRTTSATSDNTTHTVMSPNWSQQSYANSQSKSYASSNCNSSSSEDTSKLSTKSPQKALKPKKSLASLGKLFNGLRKTPSSAQLRPASPASSLRPPMPQTPTHFM